MVSPRFEGGGELKEIEENSTFTQKRNLPMRPYSKKSAETKRVWPPGGKKRQKNGKRSKDCNKKKERRTLAAIENEKKKKREKEKTKFLLFKERGTNYRYAHLERKSLRKRAL